MSAQKASAGIPAFSARSAVGSLPVPRPLRIAEGCIVHIPAAEPIARQGAVPLDCGGFSSHDVAFPRLMLPYGGQRDTQSPYLQL